MSVYVGVDIETIRGNKQIGSDDLLQGKVRDVAQRFANTQRNHDFKREPYPTIIIESEFEKELFAAMVRSEIREINIDDDGLFDVELLEGEGGYDFYLERLALGDVERCIESRVSTDNEKHVLKKAFIDRYQTEDILYGYNLNQIKRIKITFS